MKQQNSDKKTTDKKLSKNGKKSPKAHMKANTSETFWNLLRIKNGVTLREVSELTGIKINKLSNYFTGRFKPDDYQIQQICSCFGVDFEKGKLEFDNGYNTFHHRKYSNQPPEKAIKAIKDDVEAYATKTEGPEIIEVEPKIEEPHKHVGEQIIEMVYGQLSFEEFDELITILAISSDTKYDTTDVILKTIYQKVGFEMYMKIMKLIGRID